MNLVHQQKGPRITRNNQLWQIRYITRVAQTRKNNNEDLRTASVSEQGETTLTDTIHEENWIKLLDLCVSSPHCLPLNRHTTQTSHGGRFYVVVTASTSQHPASKRLSWDESFCPQSCEYRAPILHCLHNRKSALFPSLCVSGSNNSAQCSRNPKTLHFLQRWMSNPSVLPICRELLMAHVLWSSLPRFPTYSACSSRWDQDCSTVEPPENTSVRACTNATEMSMTRIPKSLQLAALANKYMMKKTCLAFLQTSRPGAPRHSDAHKVVALLCHLATHRPNPCHKRAFLEANHPTNSYASKIMFCNSSSRPAFNSSSGNFPLSAVLSRLKSTVGTSHEKLLTAAILPANELSFALDPCPDSLLLGVSAV